MARGSKCHRRLAASRSQIFPAQPHHVAQVAHVEVPPARVTFNEENIIRAVKTLYNDELRPYSRFLKKRLAEHAGINEVNVKKIDAEQLLAQCAGSVHIKVTSEEGGEWSALLVDRAPDFVDIYDELDVYSDETWAAAEIYFRGLGNSCDITLPGGRYATAFALATRHLPFLAGFTLGRICHFTQVAIMQRKLLGYANGRIVPFSCSQAVVKAQFAEQQLHHVGSDISKGAADMQALPVADWNAARAKLQDILTTAVDQGLDSVPISNVKRLFRSTYQLELSETALGHCRLSDLLRDDRFCDVCKVQLQDRGYVILPAQAPPMETGVAAHPILNEMPFNRQTLDVVTGSISCTPQTSSAHELDTFMPAVDSTQSFCCDEPLCLEDIDNPITNEASPATVPFPFPTPSPQYSYNSMQGDACAWDRVCHSLRMSAPWTQSNSGKEIQGTEESHNRPKQLFCPDEPLDMEAANQGVPRAWMSPAPCAAWTPSPHYSTRSFVSYRLGCTDKAEASSAMSQSPSRSTSAESRSPVVSSNSGSNSSRGSSSSSNDGDREALRFAPAIGHLYYYTLGLTGELACNNEFGLASGAFNQEMYEAPCEAECQIHQQASCRALAADVDAMMTHELPRLVPPPPLEAPVLDCVWQQRPKSPALPERFMAERTRHAATVHGPTTLSISSLVGAVSVGSEAHAKGTCNPCAHFHSSKGCRSAEFCLFCHSCPPGELKRRQKAKKRFERLASEVGDLKG